MSIRCHSCRLFKHRIGALRPDYTGSASTGLRYDVYRDGALAGVTDGKSYFTEGLTPDRTYQFQVFVFDARNQQIAASRLATVSARFNHNGGNTEIAVSTVEEGPVNLVVEFELVFESDLTLFYNELFDQPRYQALRSQQKLDDFYNSLLNCIDFNFLPSSAVNFDNAMVLMVAEPIAGQIGATIEIETITKQGDMISVDVRRTAIGAGCSADAAPSGPFKLYRINSTHSLVDFVERLESQPSCNS